MNRGDNMNRRYGKVFVHVGRNDDIQELAEVFSVIKFVPVRTEYHFASNEFEYVGLSPFFEELNQGDKIPVYELTIHTQRGGRPCFDVEVHKS